MAKRVALILLNWNTPVHTANCVRSLQQHCADELFDIIIADNGSADGSLKLLKEQFPNLIYIDNQENLGFAAGNNRGLIYSIKNGYSYSLVMNTDTTVDEDIVLKLSTHLDNYTLAAAVQPAIYWMHDKTKIWNGEGSFNLLTGTTSSSAKSTVDKGGHKTVAWVTGCCMMVRNASLVRAGGFNKLFFLYYEDVDLSFRLRECGCELHYLPSGKIYHEAGVSARVEKKEGFLSPVIHYYISRNHLWIIRRYCNPWYYPVNLIYNGFYYLALLAYFKLRGRNEKARLLIKGLNEGLFTPKSLIWTPDNINIG
ncbi:glycosyltransferase family 2 protein [Mucilaginibacter sp. UR6-11]|uniref:glycosyltransferase family 2 protein n=1 Tax=Mucilaginibacter sp. UR6-11 TaxID=1435644 RepID=UPI001E2F25D8|nr:glycosyltransferase family 2 protein [Mucilaginibacter sp. UR6-11]MCC8423957.1 glycosyltransferase family 2 protein [Mucilaginibacter sp. UR6-11]